MAELGKKPIPSGRPPKAPLPRVVPAAGAPPVVPEAPPRLASGIPPPLPAAGRPAVAAAVTADTDILNGGVGAEGQETRIGSIAAIHAVPTTGDRIGKYVVDRLIGSGGMGLVIAARHEALGELVAIKLLRPKAAGDKVHAERFAREARAIIKIKSEHVVRVLDAGTLDSGAPYIVMEYLVGCDLAQILREEGALHPARGADLMLQVCEAVANAHAVSVVHRDLKPSNFFVTQRADGTTLLKVLDFGISKAMGQDGVVDPSLTETQAVFGSPTYMSPEQIRSAKHVDHRSDIWSLGVAFFEMVCGKLPFAADNVAGLLASIVADPPFFPRSFAPHLPPGLEELLLHCLQKDPAKRVQSVVDLACRIAPFATPNVETHNLVERIQRLASKAAGGQPAHPLAHSMPPPMGASTSAPYEPHHPSYPQLPPPPFAGMPLDDPRSSGVAFGSTGMDLSAEAPQAAGRSVFAAVAIGLGIAVIILGGFGAYHLGARRPVMTTTAPSPELPTAPPSTASTSTSASTATSAASASADPPPSVGAATTSTTTARPTVTKKPLKHHRGSASGGAATKPEAPTKSDPTNDRF